jgi:ABC-type sugar transport system substrate-binding protein
MSLASAALNRDAAVLPATSVVPLMTREAFASAIGLPVGVLVAQAERGYWPQITIGKRVFINVEAIRVQAAARAQEFAL